MKIVNNKAVRHAKALINDGKVDLDSSWSMTVDDENAILGDDNWAEYEKWFLAIDTDENEETKARYKYPYGKNGKVYRRGVIAAKQRASQQGDDNIAEVADELLQMIDEKYLDDGKSVMDTSPIKKVFKGYLKKVDDSGFKVEAVVSDETVDRYNEVILASAWKKGIKNFMNHPVLLSSHDYNDLKSQIGVVNDLKVKDKSLIATFTYFVGEGNEQADWAYNLAKKGLAAFSVGFIPKKYTTDVEEIKTLIPETKNLPRLVYTEVELLEISQVTVPANPSALMLNMKNVSDPIVRSLYEESSKLFEANQLVGDIVVTDELLSGKSSEVDRFKAINEGIDELKELVSILHAKIDAFNEALQTIAEKLDKIESEEEFESKEVDEKLVKIVEQFKKFGELLK